MSIPSEQLRDLEAKYDDFQLYLAMRDYEKAAELLLVIEEFYADEGKRLREELLNMKIPYASPY